MRPSSKQTVLLLLLRSILAASIASAQSGPNSPAEAKSVDVTLQIMKTPRSAAVTLASRGTIYVTPGGPTGTVTLVAWATDDTPCSLGLNVGGGVTRSIASAESFARKPIVHWWSNNVRLVAATIDNITLEIDMSHEVRNADGSMREVSHESRTVRLAEGEPHVLGFVENRPQNAGACDLANGFFQISAQITTDSSTAGMLDYDLWLVQKDGQSGQSSQRRQVVLSAGDQATVLFEPIAWQADRSTCDVRVNVSATVRGRPRDDGRIDTSVTLTERSATFVTFPGGSGRKILTVSPDEPVALVLPDLPGGLKERCAGPGPSLILSLRPKK